MALPITTDVRATVRQLFANRRDRSVVVGLVLLAAVVSMTELAATHLFSVLILPESDRSTTGTVVLVVLFLLVFGGLRLINFGREMYRINVFERALTQSVGLTPVRDSWRWATAMEVTSIMSTAGRVAVVVLACFVLAPLFGIGVLVAVLVISKALSVIFARQMDSQRELRALQVAKNPASNATKIRTRVRAGEVGSLIAYLCIMLLIGGLVWLTLSGFVAPATAFVLFVALRMLGQTITEISKGLMRYVRARAFSE